MFYIYFYHISFNSFPSLVPLDKIPYSILNTSLRLESNIILEPLGICMGCFDIACLHLHHIFDSGFPNCFFNRLDIGNQLNWIWISDVENLIRGWRCWCIGILAAPVWIRDCRFDIESRNTFDDIINIGKVSNHFSVVKHIDWLIFKDRLSKQE